MAKIKLGVIVSNISGKVGGSTFTNGRGGNVLRTNASQVRKGVASYPYYKKVFANNAVNWRALSTAQKQSWNAAVSAWQSTDVFGDLRNPTGFNLYMRLAFWVNYIGLFTLLVPRAPALFVQFLTITGSFSLSGTSFSCTSTYTGTGSTQTAEFAATAPMSRGIQALPSKFSRLQGGGLYGALPNQYTNYVNRFGIPPVGAKIFFRIINIRYDTGQTTPWVYGSCIVTA